MRLGSTGRQLMRLLAAKPQRPRRRQKLVALHDISAGNPLLEHAEMCSMRYEDSLSLAARPAPRA